ncbi:hypothetical protein [Enterobacter sp. ENT03]|uniref:hypothetical protein n=1 Tax=Enterobacter sp. ENT03 TaxID=2854780 RepID=UPI001C490039|nr:hypothetical protein [Enterobacter sp. ENT03]MBV7404370.1 hypothetical protein [Enterobacter sp. ENT03]
MIGILKRGRAAVKVKNHVTDLMTAMRVSFRELTTGERFDETTLHIVCTSIIVAAIMERGVSSPRLMTALSDHIMNSYGLNLEEMQLTPVLAHGMLKGVNGKDPQQVKMSMLNDICPGHEFSVTGIGWFEANMMLVREQIDSNLKEAIHILSR